MTRSLLLLSAWAVVALGLGIQFLLRDRVDSLALVYHVTPLPVLAAMAFVADATGHVLRWRWRWLGSLVTALLMGLWLGSSWKPAHAAAPDGPDDLRVLVWNIGRPAEPSQALIDLVRELHPDIVTVIEPGRAGEQHLAAYEQALPGYSAAWMPRGITWLSRLPSRYRHRGKLDGRGAYAYFEVDWKLQKLPVVAVDVYGRSSLPRGPQIRECLAHAGNYPSALIMGDFNTPPGSVHFDAFRESMQDAFETAGSGFRETWPMPLPVLTLDYVWAGKNWEVLEARTLRSAASDHAALFVRMRLALVSRGR